MLATRELFTDGHEPIATCSVCSLGEFEQEEIAMEPIEEFGRELAKLRDELKDTTPVRPALYTVAEVFTLIFCEIFASEAPRHQLEDRAQGVSRSNWTYHVAFAIRKAAQTMDLNCTFETMGRLDAVIETIEDTPRNVLLAEWEWDYESVLGTSGELEKLWKGASRLQYANALLFTYCPVSEYYGFAKTVIQYWQNRAAKTKKGYPILYLPHVLYKEASRLREFQSIHTIEVHAEGVKFWNYPIIYRAPYTEQ
jgi:hypothetical protein